MFSYTICNEPDKELFDKQCRALEKNIPGLIKKDFLHDVDDSMTQIYAKDDSKIFVHNSYYIGALYIDSEIQLEKFFKQ